MAHNKQRQFHLKELSLLDLLGTVPTEFEVDLGELAREALRREVLEAGHEEGTFTIGTPVDVDGDNPFPLDVPVEFADATVVSRVEIPFREMATYGYLLQRFQDEAVLVMSVLLEDEGQFAIPKMSPGGKTRLFIYNESHEVVWASDLIGATTYEVTLAVLAEKRARYLRALDD
ncbi:hypothetical protein HMPREF0063_10217 [Aeromicrobium marinum DSM 15272]|uniref:Uncharacterized protein n=1 Tax=Aeromicrobium marinum DSM 15272 TaxID=585531 RepID=E2S860_9ACTN|nr:hypothetical protein [Aeromicrobium marinum]EFQ84365.1 hypothetical protein HMPREF0063_10217 [Aeromicrobium marinum DSM 15272]